jgi:hypothetical protein
VIIGVTDEPPALVDRWVADVEAIYPIVSTDGSELEEFLGVKGFPTAAVVSPQGVLSFAGFGSYQGPLDEALDEAEKGALLPKVFSKAQKKLDAGDRDGAYVEFVKLLDAPKSKLDEAETAVGKRWRTWIEESTAAEVAEGQQLLEEGWVYKAWHKAEPLAKSKAGYPATQDAQALLEQVEAVEDFKDEMKGGELYAEADQLSRSKSTREDALELLGKIVKKYEGLRIATHASEAIEELRSQS